MLDKVIERVKQQVTETVKDRSLGMFGKFKSVIYGLTLGLIKEYQDKTLELVRIQAASVYLKGAQLIHRQIIGLAQLMFLLLVLAIAIVIVPIALVALSVWTLPTKMGVILVLGVIDIAVPAWLVSRLLSEEKWMEFTKSKEILERLKNGNGF